MSDDLRITLNSTDTRPRPRRLWANIALLVLTGLSVWLGVAYYDAGQSLQRGKRFLRQMRNVEAEAEFQRFIRWHHSHAEARLLLAEAVVKGDRRQPQDAAEIALDLLQGIPDSSPLAAEARMRQARLALFILQRPTIAEELLLKSVRLNAQLLDSHFLLWKLCDLTERFQHAEAHFWNVYRLTEESAKAERLREWYTSQFSPGAATAELDRRMGFLQAGEVPNDFVSRNRLSAFMKNESDSAVVVAANARALLDSRERDAAVELLLGVENLDSAIQNHFFLFTLIEAMLELGRLEEAKSFFGKWRTSRDGYFFWRTAGRIAEIAERNDKPAVEAYDKALNIWPGPAEWTLMHRRAQCLARLGDREEAEKGRQESKRIERLMETEIHNKLRLALVDLKDPGTLKMMVEFYRSLNRARESTCWQTELERLLSAR